VRLDVTVAADSSDDGGTLLITGPAVPWLFVLGFACAVAGVALRAVRRQ
jgi:hypothetical protein